MERSSESNEQHLINVAEAAELVPVTYHRIYKDSDKDVIELLYLYFDEKDIPLAIRTLRCESNMRHEGIYGDGGRAYGIAQFHKPTFNSFKKTANLPELEYKDREDQIQLMGWAFRNNLKHHWTCARKYSKM